MTRGGCRDEDASGVVCPISQLAGTGPSTLLSSGTLPTPQVHWTRVDTCPRGANQGICLMSLQLRLRG